MLLLEDFQIRRKIQRLSFQILENNFDRDGIILIGINERGYKFASLIKEILDSTKEVPTELTQINIELTPPYHVDIDNTLSKESVAGKTVIIVDDVANSGRTLFYALQPLFSLQPDKLEIAVLVERAHKKFPVQPDYIGISLHTTLQERIDVLFKTNNQVEAHLK